MNSEVDRRGRGFSRDANLVGMYEVFPDACPSLDSLKKLTI